ncbi:MAG: hypothetical protein LBH40_03105 [Alphaproteobacteria bacterium]|jgi:hypothetical protein|nr:hypothetical protein [Alphaproteobacteria bacterium]
MRLLILITLLFISNLQAFETISTKTVKIKETATKIEVKIPATSEFKGKLKGIATLTKRDKNEFYIIISWNEFVDQKNNNVKQLDSEQFKSNFLSQTDYIKINQSVEVSGNLATVVSNKNTSSSSASGTTTANKNNSSTGGTQSVGTMSTPSNNSDNKNSKPVIPTPTRSSLSCDPSYDFDGGYATVYYEEFYTKQNGDTVVTKPCSPSKEVVKIEYEECEILHDFANNQSWRKRSSYITTREGRREATGCLSYAQPISHQFNEDQCQIKQIGDVAIINAKRFIKIPETNQTITISDCEPIANQNLLVDLKGCDVRQYLHQKESATSYPAGKLYIEKDGQRVYIDSSCRVLTDYGKSWTTSFARWEHNDGENGKADGWSKEWWTYKVDFSQFEGGAKINIEDYVKNEAPHEFLREEKYTYGKCGNKWNPDEHRSVYRFFKRLDGSEYSKYWADVCE